MSSNSNPRLRQEALAIALNENGTMACGGTNASVTLKKPCRNWGSEGPEKYLRAVDLGGGHDYCGAFVYWCFEEASKKVGLPNPLNKIRTRSASGVLQQAREKGCLVTEPQPGDVFIMFDGDKPDHVGFVYQYSASTPETMNTMEGNTYGRKMMWGAWQRTNRETANCKFARF